MSPKSRIAQTSCRHRREGGYALFLVFALLGGLALVLGVGWFLKDVWTSAVPNMQLLRTHFPVVVPLGRQLEGKNSKQLFKVRWTPKQPEQWVPLSQISRFALGAVVVSEDWAFFSHRGYDLAQIREAVKHDLERGSFSRGASTITQQLVKNLFLSSEKTLLRKLKEFYLAVKLDRAFGKKKILETYFNIVEWGRETFGVSAASALYFKKHPSDLTPREGAFLAMLLPSPLRYSQSFRQGQLTPYAQKTIHRILEKMVRAGYLTPEEASAARVDRMVFEKREVPPAQESSDESMDEFISEDEEIDQEGSQVDN